MSKAESLRLTVGGAAELAVELDAAAVDSLPAPARGERVIAVPQTSGDRAAGIRRFEVLVAGWRLEVAAEPARRAALRARATRAAAEHRSQTGLAIRAQIPGRLVRVWVTEGEEVALGQRLLAVEAMKMENEIRAPHGGRVSGLRVALGELVERGDELLTIA